MNQENIWDIVLSKTDIINIISEYVPLSKQGKNFKACCPFHGEKTPSFIVSPDKQIFKCFGCDKSGNALKFLELYKNISSLEALKLLAQKTNIDISSYLNSHKNNHKNQEEIKIIDVLSDANKFFQYQLLTSNNLELKNFLNKRNLDRKIIKDFEIGYAPKNISIFQYLKDRKHNDYEINSSSLISQNIPEANFFNDRLTFPIKDKDGNVVGFSARIMNSNDSNNVKYLNSYETTVFKKNEILFNYYNCKEIINKTKEVYIVEGQFDAIALHKINFKNVVATMGTTLSIKHLNLLKNLKLNLFFDNDEAGKKATLKNLKSILYFKNNLNLNVSFIINNLNKDADEIFNLDNGQTLNKLVNNKLDLSEWLISEFLDKNNFKSLSNDKKINILKSMFEYAYYLDSLMFQMFKSKIISEKYIDENLFASLEKEYLKPNFPSDQNFQMYIKSNNNNSIVFKTSNNYQNYNYDLNNFNIDEISDENIIPNLNFKKKKKKIIFGRGLDISLILKSILTQPSYLDDWNKSAFAYFDCDGDNQLIKELINYAIKHKGKNPEEIKEIILTDKNLNQVKIETYLNILEYIKSIDISLTKEQFNDKVSKLNNEKTSNMSKKILKIKN